jgi:hypothetical protein
LRISVGESPSLAATMWTGTPDVSASVAAVWRSVCRLPVVMPAALRCSRANTLTRSLEDITVGELRRLLHADLDERETIGAALTALHESDQASAAHEADVAEFERYRAHREDRRAAALAAAAAAADRGTTSVTPTNHGWQRRQDARVEAAEAFERREPRLEFADWQQLGRPEVHGVETGAFRRAMQTFTELVQ